MKMYWGVKVRLHTILISILGGGKKQGKSKDEKHINEERNEKC
jgi:hypothetical protein